MIIITVNGQQVNLGQPVVGIKSLVIVQHPYPMPIPAEHVLPLAQWVYDLAQQAETIMYNNTIMTKSQILSPTEVMQKRNGH